MSSSRNQLLFIASPAKQGSITDGRRANRAARSHAIRAGLEKRRVAEREDGGNFRVVSCQKQVEFVMSDATTPRGRRRGRGDLVRSEARQPTSIVQADIGAHLGMNPFEILAGDARELDQWLKEYAGTSSPEPIFTVADELVLHNFRRLFKEMPSDDALRSAAMLTISFAAAGLMDRRSLEHQSRAMKVIGSRVIDQKSCDGKCFERTVASILLLAGIEARLAMPSHVQLHLNAVKQLLFSRPDGLRLLTGETKRAIFWQDLNSSVMTGSTRIINHTTFSELQWRRESSITAQDRFTLQEGFVEISHLLSPSFIEILQDVRAFQFVRDSELFPAIPKPSLTQIDNHQASIQSRLLEPPEAGARKEESALQECLRLGTYLCCAMLRCRIWTTSGAPWYLSSQLFKSLQRTSSDPVWTQHSDVLMWLLFIGGAFSPTDSVLRNDFRGALGHVQKLQSSPTVREIRCEAFRDWPMTVEFLRRYVWSERAYTDLTRAFWGELGR